MRNVMLLLHESPPQGWTSELLASHAEGSVFAKWRAFRKAKKELAAKLSSTSVDVIHIHSASDWSFRRKAVFLKMAKKAGVPTILHLHSGKFDRYAKSNEAYVKKVLNIATKTVVLSQDWKQRLSFLGHLEVIENPVDPKLQYSESVREANKFLLLGRPDVVKGHSFAIQVVELARQSNPNITLVMTGQNKSQDDWVQALGWISEEEKIDQLKSCQALLVPSKFEGQPLVIFEALACGTPVIASDSLPPTPNYVTRVSIENPQAWSNEILKASSQDYDNEEISKSTSNNSIDSVSNQWKELYESIIA